MEEEIREIFAPLFRKLEKSIKKLEKQNKALKQRQQAGMITIDSDNYIYALYA